MLTLKRLDETQTCELYESHMKRDFPANELKKLSSILRMLRAGVYDVVAAYRGNRLAAYALMYCPETGRIVLLDYLAVLPAMRGEGIGSLFLKALREHYGHSADALMIECERPKSAPDEHEARKRIRFYTGAGARLTDVRIWLFDVEYSILVLPCCEKLEERNWAEQMLSLYRQMLPDDIYAHNVRLLRG